jgi:hypothetical protein
VHLTGFVEIPDLLRYSSLCDGLVRGARAPKGFAAELPHADQTAD